MRDCFIAAMASDGSRIRFATYLGGNDLEDINGMALDSMGNILATGYTYSTDFPTTKILNAEGTVLADIFVTALSPDGTSLRYSTALGGDRYDRANGIAVQSDGTICLAATTYGSDFPTTGPAFDGSPYGEGALIIRLTPRADSVIAARRLGGNGFSEMTDIALDEHGNMYFSGSVYLSEIPTTPDAFRRTRDNTASFNAIAVVVSRDVDSLLYATYLGPTDDSEGSSNTIACARDGSFYVAGRASSAKIPPTPGTINISHADSEDIFVARIFRGDPSKTLVAMFGGKGYEYAWAMTLDDEGRVYLCGGTRSSDFPTTPRCLDSTFGFTFNSNTDGFVAVLAPQLDSLLYSTYLGGNYDDWANCIMVDHDHRIVIAGHSESFDFPANHPQSKAHTRAFILMLLAEPEPAGVDVRRPVSTQGNAVTIVACVPTPARDHIDLDFNLARTAAVTFTLVAADGTEVMQSVGERIYDAGRNRATIDITGLASGIYWLHISNGSTIDTTPIVVVH
jgi:hypothetical protein